MTSARHASSCAAGTPLACDTASLDAPCSSCNTNATRSAPERDASAPAAGTEPGRVSRAGSATGAAVDSRRRAAIAVTTISLSEFTATAAAAPRSP